VAHAYKNSSRGRQCCNPPRIVFTSKVTPIGRYAVKAENGKVAVEMVRRLSPDIVMLDLSLPLMNGVEAARHIRDISPSA
jgi:CheY-like chemotaxis protein